MTPGLGTKQGQYKMSNTNYLLWAPQDVSDWLGSLSLHHLIPNFDRMQMDGPKLAKLSDSDLRTVLRLTKPAEVMAIRGAISKLVDDAARPVYHEHNRRISGPSPRTGSLAPSSRDRLGSGDKKGMSRTVPREHHRNTIAASEPLGFRQPKLTQGSAPELIDKDCKYSGWIRKQGGGFKNCKIHIPIGRGIKVSIVSQYSEAYLFYCDHLMGPGSRDYRGALFRVVKTNG